MRKFDFTAANAAAEKMALQRVIPVDHTKELITAMKRADRLMNTTRMIQRDLEKPVTVKQRAGLTQLLELTYMFLAEEIQTITALKGNM
jgi:hypothetical protein